MTKVGRAQGRASREMPPQTAREVAVVNFIMRASLSQHGETPSVAVVVAMLQGVRPPASQDKLSINFRWSAETTQLAESLAHELSPLSAWQVADRMIGSNIATCEVLGRFLVTYALVSSARDAITEPVKPQEKALRKAMREVMAELAECEKAAASREDQRKLAKRLSLWQAANPTSRKVDASPRFDFCTAWESEWVIEELERVKGLSYEYYYALKLFKSIIGFNQANAILAGEKNKLIEQRITNKMYIFSLAQVLRAGHYSLPLKKDLQENQEEAPKYDQSLAQKDGGQSSEEKEDTTLGTSPPSGVQFTDSPAAAFIRRRVRSVARSRSLMRSNSKRRAGRWSSGYEVRNEPSPEPKPTLDNPPPPFARQTPPTANQPLPPARQTPQTANQPLPPARQTPQTAANPVPSVVKPRPATRTKLMLQKQASVIEAKNPPSPGGGLGEMIANVSLNEPEINDWVAEESKSQLRTIYDRFISRTDDVDEATHQLQTTLLQNLIKVSTVNLAQVSSVSAKRMEGIIKIWLSIFGRVNDEEESEV